MVLLKRKEVEMVPPPDPADYDPGDDPDVYYMASTGEVFLDYESYAQRLSFYNQPIFQDELTGKLNLTYFQAIQSEREEAMKLHQRFPEELKGPMLRAIQFHITGRLDELIDVVFERFKDRYFKGEAVFVDLGDKYYARVMDVFPPRSLTRYHAQKVEVSAAQDGDTVNQPQAHDVVHKVGIKLDVDPATALSIDDPSDYIYSVQLIDQGGQFVGSLMEARSNKLSRDRLTFSKTILKKYLREALVRESTVASPWMVKETLAKRYGIPIAPSQATLQKNSAIKETKLSKRKKIVEEEVTPAPAPPKKVKVKALAPPPPSEKVAVVEKLQDTRKEETVAEEEKPKEKKKPLKFPIEDLEVDPVSERELKAKIVGEEPRRRDRPAPCKELGISLAVFEPLMVTYHFLHAFGKSLMLAPFALDDYQAALQHNTSDTCPLLTEIHATLINIIIRDGPGLANDLPAIPSSGRGAAGNGQNGKARRSSEEVEEGDVEDEEGREDEESGDELEDSREGSAETEENRESDQSAHGADPQESESLVITSALAAGRGWEKRTLKLEDGRAGWENSLIALIAKRAQSDLFPRMMGVLSHLTGKEHPDGLVDGAFIGDTYFTAKERYPVMPVADKLAVIHFLCDVAVMTKAIKTYFDECEATLTELRKERVELSRQRKKIIDERTAEERKKAEEANEGENGAADQSGSKASPSSEATPAPGEGNEAGSEGHEEDELQSSPEPQDEGDGDSLAADSAGGGSDSESFAASAGYARRALPSRQEALREKTLQREAQEAARQAERLRALQEQKARNAETKRLQAERARLESEEDRINAREEAIDLEFRRCFLAPRLRPLGKDRFHDKYWWFDGIGSQDLGTPDRVQYGSGRLFVQGCSQEDWKAMCDGRKEKNVVKRREIEHGEFVLEKDQWAVYDQPEQIDQLIAWLRNKGNREFHFKRQLSTFRNFLQPGMQRRLDDLAGGWKDYHHHSLAGSVNGSSTSQYDTRRSSRKVAPATAGVVETIGSGQKYLAWSNTLATK